MKKNTSTYQTVKHTKRRMRQRDVCRVEAAFHPRTACAFLCASLTNPRGLVRGARPVAREIETPLRLPLSVREMN